MYAKTREERRLAERGWQRGKILDAALEAFATRGYDGASMNAIAEVAGYSVGHVYNVVGNKDALFDGVVCRELNALFDTVDDVFAAFDDAPARRCVDELIDATLIFFDHHRLFFQIYLNETDGVRISSTHLPNEALARRHRKAAGRLRALFKRAVEEGDVVELPPRDLATAYDELLKGFIAHWANGGYPGKISRKSKVIKRILWHGIHK